MFPFHSTRRAVFGFLPGLLFLLLLPAAAAPPRLTSPQETRLRQALPKTLARLEKREPLLVLSIGDSLSTFYQPPGYPRYDSAMAWQGRLLNRLGGYFFYHGIVDLEPHREIATSQKEATTAWAAFTASLADWERSGKGPSPMAPDALRFRADLTAPIPLTVPELIRRGLPTAQQIVQGTAIQIHNLARDGATAGQALEALGPEAFPPAPAPSPDLVTICYGMNDAALGLPLEPYRAYLTQAVKICQERGAEVLLAAPPLSYDPAAARPSLGRTRPYATIAREVAAATGAAFVDLGLALLEAPSDLPSLTAMDAFPAATVPVARAFSYRSGITETLHPNAAATLRIGEQAAAQLLDGPLPPAIQVTGSLNLTGPGTATAHLRLFNPTTAARTLIVSPLSFSGWRLKPGTPDLLFNLLPGKARRLTLPLIPLEAGPAPETTAVEASLLLCDDDLQTLRDVLLPVTPVAVTWPLGRMDGPSAGDLLPLTPVLHNQTSSPLTLTPRLHWLGKTQDLPALTLPAHAKLPLTLRLPLPDPATTPNLQANATLDLILPDRTLTSTHHLQGTPCLTLEKRTPLHNPNETVSGSPADSGTGAPPPANPDTWLTPYADDRGLYLLLDLPPASAPGPPGTAYGTLELTLDARDPAQNATPGYIPTLSATLPWQDGPILLKKIPPTAFGHTYRYTYHPDSFRLSLTTRADGTRRLEFNIARINLAQHQWSLDGTGQNTLGINLRLSRPSPKGPPLVRLLTTAPFGPTDPRSLTLLQLTRTPTPRWSLRQY